MKCKYCGKEIINPKFCNNSCAAKYNNKKRGKRSDITKKKISESLTGRISGKKKEYVEKICPVCKIKFYVNKNNKQKMKRIYCSKNCKNKCPILKEKYSEMAKKRCSTLEEKNRMREIGRKGGFGTKGYLKSGIRYESLFEKKCFIWLEENNIKFIPHKRLPNSAKVTDIYISNKNLWIELDGIDRRKKQKFLKDNIKRWEEKIKLYEQNELNYKIFYNTNELIDFIGELF